MMNILGVHHLSVGFNLRLTISQQGLTVLNIFNFCLFYHFWRFFSCATRHKSTISLTIITPQPPLVTHHRFLLLKHIVPFRQSLTCQGLYLSSLWTRIRALKSLSQFCLWVIFGRLFKSHGALRDHGSTIELPLVSINFHLYVRQIRLGLSFCGRLPSLRNLTSHLRNCRVKTVLSELLL